MIILLNSFLAGLNPDNAAGTLDVAAEGALPSISGSNEAFERKTNGVITKFPLDTLNSLKTGWQRRQTHRLRKRSIVKRI